MKKPNIIFLIIDSLRADQLGCYGYKYPTTPNMDKLAKDSTIFKNAISCGTGTDPSFMSIITSTYTTYNGVSRSLLTASDEELALLNAKPISTIAKFLSEEGYNTIGFDWLLGWFKKGFKEYVGPAKDMHKKRGKLNVLRKKIMKIPFLYKLAKKIQGKVTSVAKIKLYEDDKIVTDRILEKIEENVEGPFYMQAHFNNIHQPYTSNPEFAEEFKGKIKFPKTKEEILKSFRNPEYKQYYELWLNRYDDPGELIAAYNGQLKSVDVQVGRIVEKLKEKGIYDDTILIITSDHGESFYEKEIYFAHHQLYQPVIHVPLIVKTGKKNVSEELVQHTDIFPTIADLIGKKLEYTQGESFKPILEGKKGKRDFAVCERVRVKNNRRAFLKGKYKFLYSLPGEVFCKGCMKTHGPAEELYDLSKDPKEENNIAKDKPEVVKEMKSELLKWIEKIEKKKKEHEKDVKKASKEDKIEDKEKERIQKELRKMGYIN